MTAPLIREITQYAPAVGTAGNTENTVAFQAPFDCVVTGVTYVPKAAITGAATNNRAVALVNKGADGSETVSVASLAFASGVNAAALDEKTITLSGTAANLELEAGDTLLWASTPNGTGATDPGGLVKVTVSRS